MKNGDNRSKNVTMADIARVLGISVVSVSNALADKKGVSAKLRAEVQLKARELGYLESSEEIPVQSKREESSLHSGDIGIISPQRYMKNEEGFPWQLYKEIAAQLKKYDSYAILDIVSENDENTLRLPRAIDDHLVSGLIMLGSPGLRFLNEINKSGLPIVFLDFSIRDYDFTSVVGDDYYDMYRLGALMISRGHSNLCYLTADTDDFVYDRYLGYCRAVTENGISPRMPRLTDNAAEMVHSEGVTAFLCENHEIAVALIEKLKAEKISVPENVSVACFSDVKPDENEKITCVCRDPSQMARIAVDALRNKLSGAGKGEGRISVAGKLVIGTTTRSILI